MGVVAPVLFKKFFEHTGIVCLAEPPHQLFIFAHILHTIPVYDRHITRLLRAVQDLIISSTEKKLQIAPLAHQHKPYKIKTLRRIQPTFVRPRSSPRRGRSVPENVSALSIQLLYIA